MKKTLPSRSTSDPKFKPVHSSKYTVQHLRRTWRKARLLMRIQAAQTKEQTA
jgi:hypothetical protein